MAFYLEERDGKFLLENQTPNIGPGQYSVPGAFPKPDERNLSSDAHRLKRIKQPAFSSGTRREQIGTASKYNPGPGSYLVKESFKVNFSPNTNLSKDKVDPGVFYVMENGNL